MKRWVLLLLPLLASCMEPETPDVRALYYVENRRDTKVHIALTTHLGDAPLRTDSIQPSGTEFILQVIERAGVLLPSAFMETFTVVAADSLGVMDTIYNGVHDTDWQRVPITNGRETITFVVE